MVPGASAETAPSDGAAHRRPDQDHHAKRRSSGSWLRLGLRGRSYPSTKLGARAAAMAGAGAVAAGPKRSRGECDAPLCDIAVPSLAGATRLCQPRPSVGSRRRFRSHHSAVDRRREARRLPGRTEASASGPRRARGAFLGPANRHSERAVAEGARAGARASGTTSTGLRTRRGAAASECAWLARSASGVGRGRTAPTLGRAGAGVRREAGARETPGAPATTQTHPHPSTPGPPES